MQKDVILTPRAREAQARDRVSLNDKRREVAERIKEAREFGDISENSEYDDAKNEQAMLEARIASLEDKLRSASVIDATELSQRRRARRLAGRRRGRGSGKALPYTIVGSTEADPAANRLSNESPVGKALLGRKQGDVVTSLPSGKRASSGSPRSTSRHVEGRRRESGDASRAAPRASSTRCARRASTRSRTLRPGRDADRRGQGAASRGSSRGEETDERVRVAGRIAARRGQGKAAFLDLVDRSGRMQLHARADVLGEESLDRLVSLDLGDLSAPSGTVFGTRRGELSLKVDDWTLLAKSLRAPPEKHHGLTDVETRYRQRELDLIANEESREICS